MADVSTIQRRFTLTVPKRVRQQAGLREGMDVAWKVRDGEIILQPVTVRTLLKRFKGEVGYGGRLKREAEKALLGSAPPNEPGPRRPLSVSVRRRGEK